ncbi:hypothetical protein K449DRAFT_33453 [Hypoxylon sp. EC38]|nr:hypothetical protein K449DRAFT_33453 [Hypoxylon sp. EC38]
MFGSFRRRVQLHVFLLIIIYVYSLSTSFFDVDSSHANISPVSSQFTPFHR